MKHIKEWHTCNRCGAEIRFKPKQQLQYVPCGTYSEPVARFTEDEISCELHKIRFCGRLKKIYELCPKCRKDFERFMKNDLNIRNNVYEMTNRQAKAIPESNSRFVQFSGIIRETGEHVSGVYEQEKITDNQYGIRRFVRYVRIFHLSSKLTNESKEAVLTLEYGENPCTTITNVYTVESGNKLIEY